MGKRVLKKTSAILLATSLAFLSIVATFAQFPLSLMSVLASPALQFPTSPQLKLSFKEIGFTDLQNTGLNSDVWAIDDLAFVGVWGAGEICPSDTRDPRIGIRIISISDPSNPKVINVIPIPPGTRANDFKALRVSTEFFSGTLLIHSLERCRAEELDTPAGIMIWDISDPASPVLLSFFSTGEARGVHNLFPYQRGGRAFVLLAVPSSNLAEDGGDGRPADLRIVEITDPRMPVEISSFNIFEDAPNLVPEEDPERGKPVIFIHDVWVNKKGTMALLAHWDAGLIILDISKPETPVVLGVAQYWPEEEGNTHSAVFALNDKFVVVGDETFGICPEGFIRIFDVSDPTNPVQVGTFKVPETDKLCGEFTGFFTAHNMIARQNLVFVSWYTKGIIVIDISNPASPRLITAFTHVKPTGEFTHPFIPANVTMFWGVFVHDSMIVASDINAGFFILQLFVVIPEE